ncbi:MAG: hypothetical protein V3U65_19885 [Granulosicoccaceae bacterium]
MNLPCIITALPAESRSFIEHFKLQGQDLNGLQLYTSDHCLLLQTGIGKLAAAGKVAAILQERPDITGIINVGIAGCDAPLGTQLVAGCVEDAGSGKRWFPHLPPLRALPDLKSVVLQTHDKPETHYQSGVAFDMEAAGVFSAARGRLDSSSVQSVKVVSDNQSSLVTAIDKAQVFNWMASCIPTVDTIIKYLQDPIVDQVRQVDAFTASLAQQMHFTATQMHQLHRMTTQHLTLCSILPVLDSSDSTAKAMLQRLKSEIAAIPLSYTSTSATQV